MPETILKESKQKMDKALEVCEHDLSGLRTGRASIHVLDPILVSVYGAESPINQVATVSTPDAATIMVQPWDKNVLGAIEKAILQANIGLTPNNDGKTIRLNVPQLTEETRKDIVKQAHHLAEESRVAIRNVRRHVNDEAKQREKDHAISEDDAKRLLTQIQKMTDEHIKRVDELLAAKEKEVMTV